MNKMVYLQPSMIYFPLVSIILICVISPGESVSESVEPDADLPLPENRTISRQLELSLHGGAHADCSTDDGYEAMASRGLKNRRRRWKKFRVYPDPSFNESERTLINNAMFRLSRAVPCLRFELYRPGRKPSGDYVHIRKHPKRGCRATVGRRGGAQRLNLAPRCWRIGTIMHEMIHSLGFYHEHSRPDRDDYVQIYPGNIKPENKHNFRKNKASDVTTFGVPYNPRSIMHYWIKAFSRNGQPTITAKNGGEVGSTGELQSTDITKLRRMYKCKNNGKQ